MKNPKGFTLIELMITVVIIGILAAIAIPNFISMQDRAREGAVKSNAHNAQLAMEDFAIQNDGIYATGPEDMTPNGKTVEDLCPNGVWPENPFTGQPSSPDWGKTAQGREGEFSFQTATETGYFIDCAGKDGYLLSLTLTNNN